MKIKNTSKQFDTNRIRSIIDHCRDSGVPSFDIWVKGGRDWAGAAYYAGCSYGRHKKPYISIRAPKVCCYPYTRRPRSGYLGWVAYKPEDALVHLVAHEIRHLWQSKHKKGHRVWGAKGKFSERDADAYAIHKVREWRRK